MYSQERDSISTRHDTIKRQEFLKQLSKGFFPTKFLNIDLKYLIKYNQHEGFRVGLGGETSSKFSEAYRLEGYVVHGFADHKFKYKAGTGFRVAPKTDTWINLSYTHDLQETGSSNFLTDKRSFTFFEPRLLNINLFHEHKTVKLSVDHELAPKLDSETQLSTSRINPTYDYIYTTLENSYTRFNVSTAQVALQWDPFSEFSTDDNFHRTETVVGYPKFTLQYTKSLKNIFESDFNFTKFDFRSIYKFNITPKSSTEFVLTSGLALGDTPLTHLYHAYPNNIQKETIMQRFSVAGINSFETMFFNEFFSDRFTTLQLKHALAPFRITKHFKPQLVLITRYAVGDISHIERHENIEFGRLNKGYTESGFEINKILLGFGLSFAYRYGAYHLDRLNDNIAFKFTFNLTL